jgi:hypothetical protein
MRLILNEDTSSQIRIARCFRTTITNVAVAASLCRGAFPFVAGQHGGTALWLHASPTVQMQAVLNSLKAMRRRIEFLKRDALNLEEVSTPGTPYTLPHALLRRTVSIKRGTREFLLNYF